jgi:hypothetical protein
MTTWDDPHPFGFSVAELVREANRSGFHPALTAKLRWLADDGHLSGTPKLINNSFADLAIRVAVGSPRSPESTVAVTKLVEAKDAAIRSWLDTESPNKNFIDS